MQSLLKVLPRIILLGFLIAGILVINGNITVAHAGKGDKLLMVTAIDSNTNPVTGALCTVSDQLTNNPLGSGTTNNRGSVHITFPGTDQIILTCDTPSLHGVTSFPTLKHTTKHTLMLNPI